mmetsp:Transcript_23106/g.48417  ORF Transcript_23106/g.48417 Transcript_23106/m.48417 type:complete len:208 (-) Transcript_23106:657-1280(-)
MVGRPTMAASAMVPGPALVTRQSAATIQSSMLDTKPCTATASPGPHARRSSAARTLSFFPHTTTIWHGCPSAERLLPTLTAVLNRPPTPSPPPTTRTVGTLLRPSCFRISTLLPRFLPASQKPCRTGRPCLWTCSRDSPCARAISSTASPGTKQRSTPLWNHVGWAPPRSVTTVTKGILRVPPPMRFRTRSGTSWQSGCTDTTASGR